MEVQIGMYMVIALVEPYGGNIFYLQISVVFLTTEREEHGLLNEGSAHTTQHR